MQSRLFLPSLSTTTMGKDHGEKDGSIMPASSISSISFLTCFLCLSASVLRGILIGVWLVVGIQCSMAVVCPQVFHVGGDHIRVLGQDVTQFSLLLVVKSGIHGYSSDGLSDF